MKIERFEWNSKLSKATASGDFVFVSGQVPDDADASPYVQTKQVIDKLEKYLKAAGSATDRMLFAMLFVKDLKYLDQINDAWSSHFPPGTAPARACVEATPASSQFALQVFAVGAKSN